MVYFWTNQWRLIEFTNKIKFCNKKTTQLVMWLSRRMPKGLVVVVYFPHAVQSICENKPHWAIPVIKSRHPTLWQRSSCMPHAYIRQLGRTSQSRVMVKLQGLVAIQGLNYWFKGILQFLLFVGQYCWKTGHSLITSFFFWERKYCVIIAIMPFPNTAVFFTATIKCL